MQKHSIFLMGCLMVIGIHAGESGPGGSGPIPRTWTIEELYKSYSPENSPISLSTPKTQQKIVNAPQPCAPKIYVYQQIELRNNKPKKLVVSEFIAACKLRATSSLRTQHGKRIAAFVNIEKS